MADVLFTKNYSEEMHTSHLWMDSRTKAEQYTAYKIKSVSQYKEKNAVGHEFMVFQCEVGSGQELLRLERRPGPERPREVGFILGGSSYVRVTRDTIRNISSQWDPTQFYHIMTLDCRSSSRPITLLNVCAVCYAINEDSPHYDLLKQQCYWYCDQFMTALTGFPDVSRSEGRHYERRKKFAKYFSSPLQGKTRRDLVQQLLEQPTGSEPQNDVHKQESITRSGTLLVHEAESSNETVTYIDATIKRLATQRLTCTHRQGVRTAERLGDPITEIDVGKESVILDMESGSVSKSKFINAAANHKYTTVGDNAAPSPADIRAVRYPVVFYNIAPFDIELNPTSGGKPPSELRRAGRLTSSIRKVLT